MISFEFHLEKWHEKTQKPFWFLGFPNRYLFRFAMLVVEGTREPTPCWGNRVMRMNSAHKKAKQAIKKPPFFLLHADHPPTESSKQVFAKMTSIPFADPFLPTSRGNSHEQKSPLGKVLSHKYRHKDHSYSNDSQKVPSSPSFFAAPKDREATQPFCRQAFFFSGW